MPHISRFLRDVGSLIPMDTVGTECLDEFA
jgi:hypothetical protein